ncbi:hypothetical protein HCB97_03570 [Streptococcus suis]|nr:hypothetical protein [Streptococcus suis]
MFRKFEKQHTNKKNTIIDEIEKFQEKIHKSSLTALALMEIGIVPDSNAAKEKAALTCEISHAIKDILNGMSAEEAIDKMTEDYEEED